MQIIWCGVSFENRPHTLPFWFIPIKSYTLHAEPWPDSWGLKAVWPSYKKHIGNIHLTRKGQWIHERLIPCSSGTGRFNYVDLEHSIITEQTALEMLAEEGTRRGVEIRQIPMVSQEI